MLKVETLRSAHELDRLKSRWKWLEKQGDCTLFQSYELNRIAAEWFCRSRVAQRSCGGVRCRDRDHSGGAARKGTRA